MTLVSRDRGEGTRSVWFVAVLIILLDRSNKLGAHISDSLCQAKDAKFGFGGKANNSRSKRNDSASFMDGKFSVSKNKQLPRGMAGKSGGGKGGKSKNKRPGKSKRQPGRK